MTVLTVPDAEPGAFPGAPAAELVAALQRAESGDPFAVLGPHRLPGAKAGWALRVLLPGAVQVSAVTPQGALLAPLRCVPGSDLWCGVLPEFQAAPDYRLQIDWGTHQSRLDDAYRFGSQLREMDLWLLGEGTHLRPYEALGAHPLDVGGVGGVRFAVWAPAAKRVSVVG
ncbi:MAG TPA: hypothetical protein VLA61_11730, partial [Ideonella sp.]|nr:hypothetical protein [Ideonella sp.]